MPLNHVRGPVLLTQGGMVAERLVRCFWPLWSVAFVGLVPWLMGWLGLMPSGGRSVWFWALGVALVLAAGWGLWRFRWPSRAQAESRVDALLPGRPIAAIRDRQAVGAGDEGSRAVWDAHLARMAARTRDARPDAPDLRLATRDPYSLRYMALLTFAVAFLFGTLWQVEQPPAAPTGPAIATVPGPTWEGWIEPPGYTTLPTLYLADQPPGALALMPGTVVTLRFYGEPGALTLDQSIADPVEVLSGAAEVTVARAGDLTIGGPGGATWNVSILPDAAPVVTLNGEMEVSALGEMTQPFKATDDFGVLAGTATFTLDLAAVNRQHGLAVDPAPREPIIIDLPLPFSGSRTEITENLIEDLSQHPYANLPVTLQLSVTDAAGQAGLSEPLSMTLPGRRFFQPVARAVIELRRDLLWSGANADRTVQLLRAITHRPDDLFPSETIYLRTRHILRQLDTLDDAGNLTPAAIDEVADGLWGLALLLEEGTLADARERLRRAQERLAEAMRNGASPEEIADLMQELREATDDYMDLLAQNALPAEDTTDQPQSQDETQEIGEDQIQALMDEIQRLMEEGRMAEAEELMEQLNELLENLQMQMTENGQGGRQRPGDQAMEDLGETLRDQQDLSDEAFRELQEQFNGGPSEDPQEGPNPGDQTGEQGQQGQEGEGPGQGGQPQDGQTGGDGQGTEESMAERQQALRDELERQRGNLPGLTGEEAAAAREALERAEGAMDRAEDALRDGDLAEAIDNQAQAMDALRQGLRDLQTALAENRALDEDQGTEVADGENSDGRTEPARRDPLGRQLGEDGQFGTDQTLLQGEDVYRRAEELLQELRRRIGERDRPTVERDYLQRLLDRF